MEDEAYKRALRAQALSVLERALVIVGGSAEELAQRLGASSGDVAQWLSGAQDVPQEAVDAAVQIILKDLDADRRRKQARRGPRSGT